MGDPILTVPLHFEPDPLMEPEAHLDYRLENGTWCTIWRALGLQVFHSTEEYPNHEDLLRNTPGLTIHGNFGFSICKFSEFFIDNAPEMICYQFGNIEVTIGNPTPLAIHMFNAYHDEHFHGDWEDITSLRIFGISPEYAEIVLLNTLNRYRDQFAINPQLIEIDKIEWWEAPEQPQDSAQCVLANFGSSLPSDIEPLRCFYYAHANPDPAASCIQFYRVLEYYAFFSFFRRS